MATRDDQMSALDSLIGGEAPLGEDEDSVRCSACQVLIDAETGEPLEPVDETNVDALRQYMIGSADAELGGVELPV